MTISRRRIRVFGFSFSLPVSLPHRMSFKWHAVTRLAVTRLIPSYFSSSYPRNGPADDPNSPDDGRVGTAVITRPKVQIKKPNLYRVLLLNDDYTPMEFVVHVLEQFFGKTNEEAMHIMLHVHQKGVGECGVYTYEIAETKVTQVMDFARKHQHPLQCVMEKQ